MIYIYLERILNIIYIILYLTFKLFAFIIDGNVYNINPPLPRLVLKDPSSKHKPTTTITTVSEHVAVASTINDDIHKNLVSLFMIETNFNKVKEVNIICAY